MGDDNDKKDKRTDSKGRTRTQIRVVEGYRLGAGMPTNQPFFIPKWRLKSKCCWSV